MTTPIQADAVNDWFRHVGTSMNRDDYEAGIKVIADLVELNRRLANQVVGLTDRVNDSLGSIVKAAKVGALREVARELDSIPPKLRGQYVAHIQWRADQLEES